jgi:hypothetical protein
MKRLFLVVVLACLAVPAIAQNAPGAPTPTGAAVKILAPLAGAKLTQDFIHVEYELMNPGAVPATPTFSVQLDNRAAVQTMSKNQEFTGLTPGVHNISVWVVDANGTPVTGAQATVQFILLNPAPAGGNTQRVSFDPGPGRPNLPAGGSPLPLLSLIGLGVLCGGLISAMRTRQDS